MPDSEPTVLPGRCGLLRGRLRLERVGLVLLMGWVAVNDFSRSWADVAAAFTIDSAFPGGNIIVEGVDGDTVHLRPDLRDTEGWWFYWNFRVSGAAGRTLHFRFSGRNPIGVRGPAVSVDGGATWSWLGAGHVRDSAFAYAFPAELGEAWFAFSVPYQESDLHDFLERHEGSSAMVLEQLCTSAKGRRVEALRAGRLDAEPRYRVLLTARHHACETMASFALEGLLSAVLAEEEDGQWFRRNVEVLAVPFMDKDGVEEGDQGKNRRPHDHNRDYAVTSIYPEVAALRARGPGWSKGRLRVALDLHCPYIRGKHNEDIYIVGSPEEAIWAQQQSFAALLEEINESPLPYRATSNLPFGQGWNKPDNFTSGKSFSRWAGEIDAVRLSGTLEIPYANAGGAAVIPDSARSFGRSLAKAIRAYLETPPQVGR